MPGPHGRPSLALSSYLSFPASDHSQFIDRSSCQASRIVPAKAGCAIVSHDSVTEAASLPSSTPSQRGVTELTALTLTLPLAEGLQINICTDSKDLFHLLYTHACYMGREISHLSGILSHPSAIH